MKYLDDQCFRKEQISNLKRPVFDKEKTNFEEVNNPQEYFRVHENICLMVFPNNMVMPSSHIVFTILFDLSDDHNYPLHAKTISFCLPFVLVMVNPLFLINQDFRPFETLS